MKVWDDIIRKAAKEGNFTDTRARLIDQACTDLTEIEGVLSLVPLYKYLIKSHIPMCADSHPEYYRKTMKLN